MTLGLDSYPQGGQSLEATQSTRGVSGPPIDRVVDSKWPRRRVSEVSDVSGFRCASVASAFWPGPLSPGGQKSPEATQGTKGVAGPSVGRDVDRSRPRYRVDAGLGVLVLNARARRERRGLPDRVWVGERKS